MLTKVLGFLKVFSPFKGDVESVCKRPFPKAICIILLFFVISSFRFAIDVINEAEEKFTLSNVPFLMLVQGYLPLILPKIIIIFSLVFGIHKDRGMIRKIAIFVIFASIIYIVPAAVNAIAISIYSTDYYTNNLMARNFLGERIYFPPSEPVMMLLIGYLAWNFSRRFVKARFLAAKAAIGTIILFSFLIFEAYFAADFVSQISGLEWHYSLLLTSVLTMLLMCFIFVLTYHRDVLKAIKPMQMLFYMSMPFIGALAAGAGIGTPQIVLAIAAMLMWNGAAILNDIADYKIDASMKKDRILVNKTLDKESYRLLGYFSLLIALLISAMASGTAIIFVWIIMAIAYNHLDSILLRHAIIGSAAGLLIIAGGGLGTVIFASVVSVLVAIGSVFKDYRDYEGDRLGKITLFTKYGLKKGKKIYLRLGALLVALGSIISFIYGWHILALGQVGMYFIVRRLLEARDRARAYRIIIALFTALLVVSVLL